MNVGDLCLFLESYAPTSLAEEWDNVGLLVGDRSLPVERLMTCLTITPPTVVEAIQRQANLIITHHPLPFRPLKSITADTAAGKLLWQLISHQISVYSPHTAFDSSQTGINAQLAKKLGLEQVRPLIPADSDLISCGTARVGSLSQPQPLAAFMSRVQQQLPSAHCRVVAASEPSVHKAAVACGSAGSLLEAAIQQGCDTFVTGETSFHTCLDAEAHAVCLVLLGHYASERFGIEGFAEDLQMAFPALEIWASTCERDPLRVW